MKVNGKNIEVPANEVIVIPRDTGNIVFTAAPVSNQSDFDKLCPRPNPKSVMKPGGVTSLDIEDPKFKKALDEWAIKKAHWMILKSLEATEGLEWDKVKMSDPDTYYLYIEELEESGLTDLEAAKVIGIVQTAVGIDQTKIDEATKSFLATQGAQSNSENSPLVEKTDTPSGDPAKSSE